MDIRQFYEKRNKILVIRKVDGSGDVLMHRMIFEDFKRVMPDAHITFACPKKYTLAAICHPFIDKVVDAETIDPSEYIISYNTSTPCIRHETANAPFVKKHRAEHPG